MMLALPTFRRVLVSMLAASAVLVVCKAAAFDDHVFVLTSDLAGNGNCAALDPDPPWGVDSDLEPIGSNATVRHFLGLHWVVNRSPFDLVQVIDPEIFETVHQFTTGVGSNPQDILVLDDQTAYVSCYDRSWMYRFDPMTGALLDSLDLSLFADADGLPEMSMMARDGNHLFVQIQRIDRAQTYQAVPPSYLAVVDVVANELVDVNPDLPGVQGIELAGLNPSHRMQIEPDTRRLFVSTPGEFMDDAGGIDEIDLDALQSVGFVTSEAQFIAGNIGGFVMVSAEKGYVLSHTDLLPSSHLGVFSRLDGSFLAAIYETLWVVTDNMAFDPETSLLFFPDPGVADPGIHVFDTVTDTRLTPSALGTGLPPHDAIVVRQTIVSVPGNGRDGFEAPDLEATLDRTYPNPFNPHTTIAFSLARPERIRISVFDLTGQLVADLADRVYGAGSYLEQWDGKNHFGGLTPSGTYLVRMESEGRVETRKVMLVR